MWEEKQMRDVTAEAEKCVSAMIGYREADGF